LFSILVYLVAVPFLLVGGLGVVIFSWPPLTCSVREYFELAAMRQQPVAEAKRLRNDAQRHGLCRRHVHCSLRIDTDRHLATPLFAMAFMVHMYKRMTTTNDGSPHSR